MEELEFLRRVRNHKDQAALSTELGSADANKKVREKAVTIARKWFSLGQQHLSEGDAAVRANAERAGYSRAYYAAYSASKAIRYLKVGNVSLKGDDHQEVGNLPEDFPDLDQWSKTLTELYESRLRADYDNWDSTAVAFKYSALDCVEHARNFLVEAERYFMALCAELSS